MMHFQHELGTRANQMRKPSNTFTAAARRGLAWLSLLATSGSIAYAMTTALVSGRSAAVDSVPIRAESEAARDLSAEAEVLATLRRGFAARGLDSELVNAPMFARAPGQVTAADFVDDNGIATSIGAVQSQAWLVSTAAGRWWVWEYFVTAPADGRALMHDSGSYGP